MGIDHKEHEYVRRELRLALISFFVDQIISKTDIEKLVGLEQKIEFKPYYMWEKDDENDAVNFFYVKNGERAHKVLYEYELPRMLF